MNQRVVGPLVEFLHDEAAGGIALLVGTLFALSWANAWRDGYEAFWHRELGPLDLHHWVNDALMAVFFFVVGLEIKRELVTGELRDRRAAALPAIAAVGGMVAARRAVRRRSPPAATAPRAGRSPRPPTSRSPSACSRCWATACPPAHSCSCWRSRSSTTSSPSRSSRCSTPTSWRSSGSARGGVALVVVIWAWRPARVAPYVLLGDRALDRRLPVRRARHDRRRRASACSLPGARPASASSTGCTPTARS